MATVSVNLNNKATLSALNFSQGTDQIRLFYYTLISFLITTTINKMCITTRATTTKVIYKVDHKAAVYKMVYNIERVKQTERVVKIKSQLKA